MQDVFKKWFEREEPAINADDVSKKPTSARRRPDLNPAWGERLRGFRERTLRESQEVFGERFGVSQAAVSRWEKGYPPQRRYWRQMTDMMGEAPDFVGDKNLPLGQERDHATRVGTIGSATTMVRLPVQGVVGAGQWVEVEHYEIEMGAIEAPADQRFPGAPQMAFLVEGDSMDLAGIPAGFYVTCVDFADSGLSLQTGMTVVVQQTRDGGHLIRRMVKEVHVFRDRYELRSRSSNPAHRTITIPIDYFDEPHEEIQVIAVVLGVYRRIPLGRE